MDKYRKQHLEKADACVPRNHPEPHRIHFSCLRLFWCLRAGQAARAYFLTVVRKSAENAKSHVDR